MNKQLICAFLVMFMAWSGNTLAATRDLVFDEEEPAQQSDTEKQTLAIKTTVLLLRDGKTTQVAPSEVFKSGDKVKLVFTPNTDGYVYWLAKGTSGNYTLLFPSAKTGMDNAVKRNRKTEYRNAFWKIIYINSKMRKSYIIYSH